MLGGQDRPRQGGTGISYSFMSDLPLLIPLYTTSPSGTGHLLSPHARQDGDSPSTRAPWHGDSSSSKAWVGLKQGVIPWHLSAHPTQLLILGQMDVPNHLSSTQAEGMWYLTWQTGL